jgi:uncharacterized protein (TIGR02757 family)
MNEAALKALLDKKLAEYNRPFFIEDDPISIPHRYTAKADREIAGFFAAVFAWGNRKTIIRKTLELMEVMDHAPHDFCLHHTERDRKNLLQFKHRTFQTTDLFYFLDFFQSHYRKHESLETAFLHRWKKSDATVEQALSGFHDLFFSLPDVPDRTRKHVGTPERGSACKRLNMYLRWMVRKDKHGVDFGLWNNIKPSQLVIPLDVHVMRVAHQLQLTESKTADWKSAVQLTETLKRFDAKDPIKYDFALFGMGVMENKFSLPTKK